MRSTLVFAVVLVIISPSALAHDGGLDDLGCHYARGASGYHCNERPLAGQTFGSRAEAEQALSRAILKITPVANPRPKTESVAVSASVVDGDTLAIRGERVRLFGIDAAESRQMCSADGRKYRCGHHAAIALANMIGQDSVNCEAKGRGKDNQSVAVCRIGSEDLGAWMVSEGWALADREQAANYVSHEETARQARRGLWRGTFQAPRDWRQAHP